MPVTAPQCGGRNPILRRPGCRCDATLRLPSPLSCGTIVTGNGDLPDRDYSCSHHVMICSGRSRKDWPGERFFFGDACMLKFISLAVLTVFFFVTADIASNSAQGCPPPKAANHADHPVRHRASGATWQYDNRYGRCLWIAPHQREMQVIDCTAQARRRRAANRRLRKEWSERRDSNPRPPVSQTGTLTGLRYAPTGRAYREAGATAQQTPPSVVVQKVPRSRGEPVQGPSEPKPH